jgi:hypothetical protein
MQISVEFFRRHLSPFWQPDLLMTQLFVQIIGRIQQLTTTFIQDEARELVPKLIDAFRGTKIMSDKRRLETLVPAIVTLFARPHTSRAFHCRSHGISPRPTQDGGLLCVIGLSFASILRSNQQDSMGISAALAHLVRHSRRFLPDHLSTNTVTS